MRGRGRPRDCRPGRLAVRGRNLKRAGNSPHTLLFSSQVRSRKADTCNVPKNGLFRRLGWICVFCLIAISSSSPSAWALDPLLPLKDPAIERRVDELLRRMTLEEKVGQLVQYSGGTATGPGGAGAGYRELIAQGQIGSLINVTGAAETNSWQRIAVENSRLKIPLLFGTDVIHGYRTIFPVPLGLASTWDPELVEQAARVAAQEASAEGIRWTFSPMVDIARDARWGRITEGAGEDPYLGSVMAAAYVRGYQEAGVAACANTMWVTARPREDATITPPTYRNVSCNRSICRTFRSAVDAGAATVMSAFNTLNGVPASANYRTLTEILRRQWGFAGLVVSDWDAIGELIAHGVALGEGEAARKALLAGVGMDMQSGVYRRSLAALVRSGAVPSAVLDEAVRRVLRVKFALGLFDHPYVDETPSGQPSDDSRPGGRGRRYSPRLDSAHVELAEKIAERSLILLKNQPWPAENGENSKTGAPLLPVDPSLRTVALIGPLADSPADMLGSWPSKGDPATAVTLRSALEERLRQRGGQVLYAKGTEINASSETGFPPALEAARQADMVLAALGEDASAMTGEAGSRTRLDLPGNQEKLLEALVATGKPVVLVVFSGRPLALSWAAAHVPAVVEAWYPGVQAGPALTRVLWGDAGFSGGLTVSVPRTVGQEPLYYDALNTGRPAGAVDLTRPPETQDEKYVSRYIDEQNTPLFPFGYGLSYTRFAYAPLRLTAAGASARQLNGGAGGIEVSTVVTNRGRRPGREVAQLYLTQRGASVALPVKALKGFKVLELAAGEAREVKFTLGRNELAFWNIDNRNAVEPGQVTVWIGPNSQEGPSAQFAIAP